MAEAPLDKLSPEKAGEAVRLGLFVSTAYQMYSDNPTDIAPPPPPNLPDNYEFLAWVQMRDYLFASGGWAFYGIMARSPDGSETVLAIRGTESHVEWWDDIISAAPAPWYGPGRVGFGFNQIYRTLRLVPKAATRALAATAPRYSAPAPFAQQVADLVKADRARTLERPGGRAPEAAPPKPEPSVKVVGHSLGSALATLYAAENARVGQMQVPLLCIFASPRVGDHDFAAAFDALNGLESWRIVNALDAVPKVPWLGFEHVRDLYEYNSGSLANPTLECWHSLDTYLHLLDPSHPLAIGCVRQRMSALRPASAAMETPGQTKINLGADKSAAVTITVDIRPGS